MDPEAPPAVGRIRVVFSSRVQRHEIEEILDLYNLTLAGVFDPDGFKASLTRIINVPFGEEKYWVKKFELRVDIVAHAEVYHSNSHTRA